MMRDVPVWAWILGSMFAVIATGVIAFTWKECGWKTVLLGNGGFYAAVLGLCDD